MIENATLLRLAREYASRKADSRRSIRAIALTGSVARGEPPLGDSTDLDILIVDDTLPYPAAELIRLSDQIFIDVTHFTTDDFADRKSVRNHHFTAPLINDSITLHDPRHYFDILQAAVRAPYYRADQIYVRAQSALAQARAQFDSILPVRDTPPESRTALDSIIALQRTLYLAATAVLLLANQPKGESAGGRKMMVRLEAAARQIRPDLYPYFISALGVDSLTPDHVRSLLPVWHDLYKAASQQSAPDPLIHPLKRGYYERGVNALIDGGHALNSLWLLEHTMAVCVQQVGDPDYPAWQTYCESSGKQPVSAFQNRIEQTQTLIEITDETLLAWARNENVEL